MRVDSGIWGKLTRLVILLLVLAAVLGVIILYLPLIKHNEALRKEIYALNTQIKHEAERSRQMDAAIRALQTDQRTVERLARERLGYAKPGEIMIRFEEPPLNNPPRR